MFFEFNEPPVALVRGKAKIEPETLQLTEDSAARTELPQPAGDLASAWLPDGAGLTPHIILDDFLF
ncbi:MAG: hypothetical protein AAGI09_01815 [Pseudomonadota bacterium]